MKIEMLIMMFFIIGALFIISENNLALRNQEGLSAFYSMYIDWIGSVFNNGISATGYVVKMNWLPDSEG
ncbi:MAG: hypothetical protein ABIE22_03285 [archaeon]